MFQNQHTVSFAWSVTADHRKCAKEKRRSYFILFCITTSIQHNELRRTTLLTLPSTKRGKKGIECPPHKSWQMSRCPLCFLPFDSWTGSVLWIGRLQNGAEVTAVPVALPLLAVLVGCSGLIRPQTLRHSPCPPRYFSPPLTFWLLSCLVRMAPHFIIQKEPGLRHWPFHLLKTEQSFTNHTAKCKISKLLILQALMKWLALLCCNYGKRSGP